MIGIITVIFKNINKGPGTENFSTYTLEIVIMLLGAFILGYLLRFFLKKDNEVSTDFQINKFTDTDSYEIQISELKDQLAHANVEILSLQNIKSQDLEIDGLKDVISKKDFEIENLKKDLSICLDSKMKQNLGFVETIKEIKKDDLKKVEGIGPKIESLLNEDGIYNYEDLASASVDFLQTVLNNAGERYRIHNPATWPRQSKLCAEGKWDDLKVLQKSLNGGRLE